MLPISDQSYSEPLFRALSCPDCDVPSLLATLKSDPHGVLGAALLFWRLNRYQDGHNYLRSSYNRIIALHPDYWMLLGLTSSRLPSSPYPYYYFYQQALLIAPGRADICYNLANAFRVSDPKKAINYYRRSLVSDITQPCCHHNYGITLHHLGKFLNAIHYFKQSIILDPCIPDVYCNLGLAYLALDQVSLSRRCFLAAISVNANHGPSHTNLGNAMVRSVDDAEQSLPFLLKGVNLQATPDAYWNLALADLLLGNYVRGWCNYEARIFCPNLNIPRLPSYATVPSSLEELLDDSENAPLIIWSEQGLGDSIQFSRYFLLLESLGVDFVFICPPPLFRLFSNWLVVKCSYVESFSRDKYSSSRYHIHLLSLPRLFKTDINSIPNCLPLFKQPTSTPQHLTINPPPGGLSVGLVWSTNPSNLDMHKNKSIPLQLLLPHLLDIASLGLIQIHSLQYGLEANELSGYQPTDYITDWSSHLTDFSDTAFLIAQLDLVISVDTAVAHLTASLNKPCWLLLPYNADFRWLRSRNDSPWYPGLMRLFRQTSHGDWTSVVDQLKQAWNDLTLFNLQTLIASKQVNEP